MVCLLRPENDLKPSHEVSEKIYSKKKLEFFLKESTVTETAAEARTDAPIETQRQKVPVSLKVSKEISLGESKELVKVQNNQDTPRKSSWKPHKILAGAHQGWVRSVVVDPGTNEWFVLGLTDAQIKLWDLASGDVRAVISGHIMAVRSLVLSKRYPYLFSGSEDKTLRCWDLEKTNSSSGCQIRDYHGHVGGIYALALHPELDVLFSSGRDSAIRVWDIRSRVQVMALTGHSGDVTSLISQTGDPQICLAGMDGTVRLWDLRNQKCALVTTQHTKGIRLLVKHPYELTMASADATGTINQWLLPGGQLLNSLRTPPNRDYDSNIINSLAINPKTNELFAGFADGRMNFYDYVSGDLTQQTKTKAAEGLPMSTIYASAFDLLGSRLITCENDKSIKIWSQ